MIVNDLKKEIEGKLENENNQVYEEVLKIILDNLENYNDEEDLTSRQLENLQNDLSYYIDNEMIYQTSDILHEVNMYLEDFNKILNSLDNCINEYLEISDITNTVCDMYFEAYKLVLNDILSYYVEQEHQKEYQKR